MMGSSALVACAIAVAVAAHLPAAAGYQVHSAPGQPCIFQGNGTCFDLNNVYPWPAKIHAGKYEYHFNPCAPLKNTACNEQGAAAIENTTTPRGEQPGIGMCQTWYPAADVMNWASGGLLEPFATWNGVYPFAGAPGKQAEMWINLPFGAAWRNTRLTLLETESENATLSFNSEAPLMQYNFVLEGKNVFGTINKYPCLNYHNN